MTHQKCKLYYLCNRINLHSVSLCNVNKKNNGGVQLIDVHQILNIMQTTIMTLWWLDDLFCCGVWYNTAVQS